MWGKFLHGQHECRGATCLRLLTFSFYSLLESLDWQTSASIGRNFCHLLRWLCIFIIYYKLWKTTVKPFRLKLGNVTYTCHSRPQTGVMAYRKAAPVWTVCMHGRFKAKRIETRIPWRSKFKGDRAGQRWPVYWVAGCLVRSRLATSRILRERQRQRATTESDTENL